MASQGPFSASTQVDQADGTQAWVNGVTLWSINVTASNAASDSMFFTNFGFTIPDGATINGIQVNGALSDNSSYGLSTEKTINLILAGAYSGTNKAGGNWGSHNVWGGSADLWGCVLTPAIVNASNFGVGIQATLNGSPANPRMTKASTKITVFYTPLPTDTIYDSTFFDATIF